MWVIVWRGLGILVPIIGGVSLLIAFLLITNYSSKLGIPRDYETASGFALGGVIAGGIIFALTYSVERKRTKTTSGPMRLGDVGKRPVKFGKVADSFFEIPMRYWAFILPVLAIGLGIGSLTPSAREHQRQMDAGAAALAAARNSQSGPIEIPDASVQMAPTTPHPASGAPSSGGIRAASTLTSSSSVATSKSNP
jgi:hypothetical protein